MDFADYFLNMGWICIKDISDQELFDLIQFESKGNTSFEEGYQTIQLNYNEPLLLSFKVNEWLFLLGKYYFSDLDTLKKIVKKVGDKFPTIYGFGLDVWSGFYCLIKYGNEDFKEVYWWDDGDVTEYGEIAESKLQGDSDEKVNLILDLSENWTAPFSDIEKVVREGELKLIYRF